MNVDSHTEASPRGAKPALTPIFGLPIGDSDLLDTAAAEPVRLHLPQIKIDAVREAADDWRNPGANKNAESDTTAARELEAALQLLAERAVRITGAAGAIIALPKGGVLSRCFVAGVHSERSRGILRATSQLFAESVRTRQVILINDAVNDPGGGETCREPGIGAVAVMPLLRDQEIRGRVEIFSHEVDAFSEGDLTTIERIGNAAQVALDLAEAAGIRLEVLLTNEVAAPVPTAGEKPVSSTEENVVLTVGLAPVTNEVTAEALAAAGKAKTGTVTATASDPAKPTITGSEVVAAGWVETAVPAVGATENVSAVSLPPEQPIAEPIKAKVEPAVTKMPAPEPKPTVSAQTLTERRTPETVSAAIVKTTAAPEPPPPAIAKKSDIPAKPATIQNCQGCGFPVSEGRLFCLNCQPPDAPEPNLAPVTDAAAMEAMPAFLLPEAEQTSHGQLAVLKNPIVLGGAVMVVLVLVVILISHFS
jgi:GAF domain